MTTAIPLTTALVCVGAAAAVPQPPPTEATPCPLHCQNVATYTRSTSSTKKIFKNIKQISLASFFSLPYLGFWCNCSFQAFQFCTVNKNYIYTHLHGYLPEVPACTFKKRKGREMTQSETISLTFLHWPPVSCMHPQKNSSVWFCAIRYKWLISIILFLKPLKIAVFLNMEKE